MDTANPLKTYRKAQDPRLSQQGLADKLEVARETVARWETGSKIDVELLPRVSDRTGIPRAELRPDLAALLQPTEAAG